jgi:hypothetical protein
VRGEGRIAQLDLSDSMQLDHDLKFRTFAVTMRLHKLDEVAWLARAGANRDEKWERGCQCWWASQLGHSAAEPGCARATLGNGHPQRTPLQVSELQGVLPVVPVWQKFPAAVDIADCVQSLGGFLSEPSQRDNP